MQRSKCIEDFDYFVNHTTKFTKWALQMIDSSSKFPSSVLTGGVDLGDFDECLTVNNARFTGKFCTLEGTAGFTNETHVLKRLLNLRSSIMWGQCIPSSCSGDDLVEQNNYINFPYKYFSTLRVASCYTATDTVSFGIITKIIMCLLLFWVLLVLAFSIFNSQIFERLCTKWISRTFTTFSSSVSLSKNWSYLCRVSKRENMLSSLHGIRMISTISVVLCHQLVRELSTPYKNSDDILPMITGSVPSMLLANTIIAVDSFMLMGGLLHSYNYRADREKQTNTSLITYVIYRYIRLTPVYAVVIFFSAEIWYHLGSGPIWKSSVQDLSRSCENNWFYNLLYISNYINSEPNKMCLPHTWYLSADMHLYCVSIVLLTIMYKKPFLGKLLICLLCVASTSLVYWSTVYHRFPWTYTFGLQNVQYSRSYFSELYVKTHMRATPYFIGLLFGDILYRRKNKKIVISQVWIWLISVLVAALAVAIIFSLYFYYAFEYNATWAALYATFHRPLWALCLAWLIFVCANGYGGIVNKFLSAPAFQVFSKLSFCIYLIHYIVMINGMAVTRVAFIFSLSYVFFKLIKNLIITLTFSIVTTLIFEIPFAQLNKAYTRSNKAK